MNERIMSMLVLLLLFPFSLKLKLKLTVLRSLKKSTKILTSSALTLPPLLLVLKETLLPKNKLMRV